MLKSHFERQRTQSDKQRGNAARNAVGEESPYGANDREKPSSVHVGGRVGEQEMEKSLFQCFSLRPSACLVKKDQPRERAGSHRNRDKKSEKKILGKKKSRFLPSSLSLSRFLRVQDSFSNIRRGAHNNSQDNPKPKELFTDFAPPLFFK